MEQLVRVAQQEQIRRMIAYLRTDNRGMKRLCERFDFSVTEDGDMVVASLSIPQPGSVGAGEGPS
jgi:hypothetical protein